MRRHTPDILPPLIIDMPDHYGADATHVRDRPADLTQALESFYLCRMAIARRSERIENAYPAHIGGTDNFFALKALAKRQNVTLQFPGTREI